ncbi:uncharacterized protein LOC123408681 isoform X3 [Hordeum vulgare subsp. vulgare]|uniref:uncharacterized protein LOC123408681 isoform X3 n=1 Tax=Hordeum vulgare subsp. vulgare TaxID=112509 RepID=UPI001D1A3738|nr:uncharacterized protein LOC123408681 isoform X3 [Hordeum vulgare subsp. vulgare]
MVVWTSMAVAGQRSMMADVVGMPHSAYHELRIKTMAADEQSLLVEEVEASVGKGSFGRAGGVQDRVEIQRPEVRLRRGRHYRCRFWRKTKKANIDHRPRKKYIFRVKKISFVTGFHS